MKNKISPFFWISVLVVFFGVSAKEIQDSFVLQTKKTAVKSVDSSEMPLEKKRRLAHLLRDFVNNIHYSPRVIDPQFSKDWFKDFFTKIDPYKRIFLREDSIALSVFSDKLYHDIIDAPNGGNFTFFQAFRTRYHQRLQEIEHFLDTLSGQKMDLSVNEFIVLNDSVQTFPLTKSEQRDRFRKQIKWMALEQIQDDLDSSKNKTQVKNKQENIPSFAEAEEKSRNNIFKSLKKIYQKINKTKEEDLFGSYLNSFLAILDPHSGYYEPKQKEAFDESISGKFEGIGAVLGMKDGVSIYVAEILPGGPASRQGELQNGDIILKVAQGDDEPESIEGMWTSDAVELIRGKKGTWVKLTVRKVDRSIKVIAIQRDIVVKEESFAKSAILNYKKQKIGYIYLPSFYVDLTREGPQRNSAGDVRKEIERLKAQNVDGIILDVRNNTGGSLQDVVTISNDLVGHGNIVQVKSKDQPSQYLQDYHASKKALYEGPLVVMVNQYSASASEILAAAIQDYHRGIILGSKHTFGKGTVQRFFELDQYVKGYEDYAKWMPLGAIKLTLQKFYRISGKSTQLNGVASDIVVPDFFDTSDELERKQPFALTCDSIAALPEYHVHQKRHAYQDRIIKNSSLRIQNSPYFKLLQKKLIVLEEYKKVKKYSLNYAEFQKRKLANEGRLKPYDTLSKMYSALTADLLTKQQPTDSIILKKEEKFVENLRKDFQLEEAVHVILDIKKNAHLTK